jgi:hypothetical protein
MTTAQVCLLLFFGVLIGFAVGWGLCTEWCNRRLRHLAKLCPPFCRRCGCEQPMKSLRIVASERFEALSNR